MPRSASPSASSRSDSAGAAVPVVPVVSAALPGPGIPKKGLVILSHSYPPASVSLISEPTPAHPGPPAPSSHRPRVPGLGSLLARPATLLPRAPARPLPNPPLQPPATFGAAVNVPLAPPVLQPRNGVSTLVPAAVRTPAFSVHTPPEMESSASPPPWSAPRPVGLLTSAAARTPTTSMASALSSAMHTCIQQFVACITDLRLSSALWVEVKDATQPAALLARAVQRYAPSTLQRYLAVWRQWCQFAMSSASNPAAPASGILPDWLLQNSSRQGLASGPWKALSWMSRVAGLPALHQALNTAVAKAFLHASCPQPRREALPFSLSFVCWLERRVMSTDFSLADRYAAGCLLCAIWGSLRWADALWVAPSSIHIQLEQGCLVGISSRTKTSKTGMCWGALLLGLTGSSSACWGLSFWSVLSQILHQSRRVDPDRVLDFLPALFAGPASAPTLLCPMHRPEAIPWIRSLLQEHWSSVSTLPMPAAYALVGVHSAKATLLSWARQLNLSESQRRIQGHHKPVGSESSVHLYGRDDIGPMLLLQQDIRKHTHSGFRPLQPVARGYSDPVPDFRVDFSAAVVASLSPSAPASHVSSESEAPGWDIVAHTEVGPDADQLSDRSPSPPPFPGF